MKVTREEPQGRIDVEFGVQHAPPVRATGEGNLRNPIDHQHLTRGQPRVVRAEKRAFTARDQFLPRETRLARRGAVEVVHDGGAFETLIFGRGIGHAGHSCGG